jgi:hypothetical protein
MTSNWRRPSADWWSSQVADRYGALAAASDPRTHGPSESTATSRFGRSGARSARYSSSQGKPADFSVTVHLSAMLRSCGAPQSVRDFLVELREKHDRPRGVAALRGGRPLSAYSIRLLKGRHQLFSNARASQAAITLLLRGRALGAERSS